MAMETALELFQHVFRIYGIPEDILSDRGPQFTSRVWQVFCKQCTSGCHPESNGQVERLNQEIGCYLRSYCSKEQDKWSDFLPWAEYAQNSSLTRSSLGRRHRGALPPHSDYPALSLKMSVKIYFNYEI